MPFVYADTHRNYRNRVVIACMLILLDFEKSTHARATLHSALKAKRNVSYRLTSKLNRNGVITEYWVPTDTNQVYHSIYWV